MRFTIPQDKLQDALQLAKTVLPTKPSHPAYASLLIETENEAINILVSNGSLWLKLKVDGWVEDGGRATIEGKLLIEYVSKLGEDDVVFELTGSEWAVGHGHGGIKLGGGSDESWIDFPLIKSEGYHIPGPGLAIAFSLTRHAVSSEISKAILNGACLQASKRGLEVCATDGHRLALVEFGDDKLDLPALVIPGGALEVLASVVAPAEDVVVTTESGLAAFETTTASLSMRLISGSYPNIHAFLPRQFSGEITTDRKALIAALDRVMLRADDKEKRVSVSFAGEELLLGIDGKVAERVKFGMKSDEPDGCVINGGYLLQALKNCPETEVRLSFSSLKNAGTISITPLGGVKYLGWVAGYRPKQEE